ncbi:UNKNOWN [Stylonychia lemnae]|uniref:Uncharacterized protein n=1 Tax=Stylonychia lemnae TaxID=5949 RepID=A0A078APZ2_STYLE|nr:UNKNOWN [Stylonychia lemnae]|eukprot:CDW84410.1 UNKNOWN [Stylonychia lemnae]
MSTAENNRNLGLNHGTMMGDQFDSMLRDQDGLLADMDQQLLPKIEELLSYHIEEQGLECQNLELNPIFQKLRLRLRQFYFQAEEYRRNGPSQLNQNQLQKNKVDFSYKIQLHRGLKRLLREVVITKDKHLQLTNLGKVYTWYFQKLESIGQMSSQEKDEEEIFLNPGRIEEIQRRNEEKQTQKREKLLNENYIEQKQKKFFEDGERTVHQDILPAKDRIGEYKTKSFGKLFQNKLEERPMSAYTSNAALGDATTQAQSVFEEDEKSVKSHPFKNFYTTGDPVVFKTQNRFEGKSNFHNYFPTNDMTEQKIEKIWFQNKNRLLIEKRREEELKQTMKEWSNAKQRIESEIQRKKEHKLYANNFEARGYVRTNWKTKNFNPESNPLEEDSSSDESDDVQILSDNEDAIVINKGKQSLRSREDQEDDDEYDDEYDYVKDDEEYDDYEQQNKMNQMKQAKDNQQRSLKSAHPRMRGSQGQLEAKQPSLHDLTKDQVGYGIRPSTAIQIKQLEMIQEYNKSLPKRKKNQSLPLIQAHNIGTKSIIKKDHKKQTVEEIIKYNAIGEIDDQLDSKEAQGSKFQMLGKVRNMKIQSAKQRIETLRKYKGDLINAVPNFTEDSLDNVFVSSNKGSDAYSLSVYNRADKYTRPQTAPTQNNWFKGMQKLQPVAEEEEHPVEPDTRLPEFKVPPGLQALSRGAIDGYRLEQVSEIESIKERLARDGFPQSMVVLQRAILMPTDVEYVPGQRKYPSPGDALMINPFPKKKKKKGKKKKGKKKK